MKSELPKQILSQSLKYSAVHWWVFNIAKAKAIAMVGSLFLSHSKITLFFFFPKLWIDAKTSRTC